jgi:hypothetical protein
LVNASYIATCLLCNGLILTQRRNAFRSFSDLSEKNKSGRGACPRSSNPGTSRATQLAGKNWLATGDAAIAFDPLSSHGITNAVYTANRAVKAIALHLSDGDEKHFQEYAESLSTIFATYLGTRYELYQRERRWPEAAFWSSAEGAQYDRGAQHGLAPKAHNMIEARNMV